MKLQNRIRGIVAFAVFSGLVGFFTYAANAAVPITTDSRIKTFVYNENEVFRLIIHYGYQSSIEFAKGETIETLSLGNSYSWNITPVDRRIFIKAIEGAAHTNMTVITNKHTYQFELESKEADDENLSEELVYVVRFFYPEESFDAPQPTGMNQQLLQPVPPPLYSMPQAAPEPSFPSYTPMMPVAPQSGYTPYPKPFAPDVAPMDEGMDGNNYDYTLTGPDSIAPIKIFDDGSATFFQFPNGNSVVPHIFAISPDGREERLSYSRKGEYISVGYVGSRFSLKLGNEVVNVFNESNRM